MARKNDGACGNPKLIRTDVDCRAARPKFDNGAWSPRQDFGCDRRRSLSLRHAGREQARHATSKLWRMPHYRATRSTSACGCLALIPRLIIAPTDSGLPSRLCLSTKRSRIAKARDGDVVELQLAHLDNSTVEGLYKKHGPLALIGSRTKLMQHWADRIDHWLDPKKVMPIKGGVQG